MSKIKARKGSKYTCVKSFKEDKYYGGAKSFVGLTYTLVSKTAFSWGWKKRYMMCTTETKKGKDVQSVVIPAKKFTSYFEPVEND
jgi:hypothetical protein